MCSLSVDGAGARVSLLFVAIWVVAVHNLLVRFGVPCFVSFVAVPGSVSVSV